MQSSVEQISSKQLEPPVAVFKLIIIGDNEVGKSTFIKKFSTEILEELIVEDQRITVHKTRFSTNIGNIQFNVWDLDAASVETESLEEFFMGADCAVLMFDVTSRLSYKNLPIWFKKVKSIHEHQAIPMVLVANKLDSKDRRIKAKHVIFHRKKNIGYNQISAEANYEIEKPFIYLARVLTKEKDLNLVESPVVQPPSIKMSKGLIDELETQMQEAEQIPLIEDEDDDDL